jgi:hypothetical protein
VIIADEDTSSGVTGSLSDLIHEETTHLDLSNAGTLLQESQKISDTIVPESSLQSVQDLLTPTDATASKESLEIIETVDGRPAQESVAIPSQEGTSVSETQPTQSVAEYVPDTHNTVDDQQNDGSGLNL